MTELQVHLINQFNGLSSDEDRWKWMQKNSKKHNITVWLDNDDTFATFDEHEESDEEATILQFDDATILQFNDYLGWTDGVQILLDILDIKNYAV